MFSSVLLFLNIGTPELIIILFAALLLFGGKKLPELAKGLGKGLRDFKDASDGVKREIHNQINNYDEPKPTPYADTYTNNATIEEKPVEVAEIPEHTPVERTEAEAPVKKDINS
ncbi:Sec-independent protein translocase subunit TatA/TatB [Mucilaginibacter sp.]